MKTFLACFISDANNKSYLYSMKEIWENIQGYEGEYQISNLGQVKSLSKTCFVNGGSYTRREKILKQSIVAGYNTVCLYKETTKRNFKVHRLVASSFVPNPANLPHVNHIDENKQNNSADNLEWCTAKQNTNHGTNKLRIGTTKRNRGQSRTVALVNDNGDIIKEFQAIVDAAEYMGARKTDICAVCRGRQASVKGHKFKYINVHKDD